MLHLKSVIPETRPRVCELKTKLAVLHDRTFTMPSHNFLVQFVGLRIIYTTNRSHC